MCGVVHVDTTGKECELDTVVITDTEVRELSYYRDELSGAARRATSQYPKGYAVYLLWHERELLYVDHTYALGVRLSQHGSKPYDYVTWMLFDTGGEARYWEGELIRAYLPDLNVDLGVNAMAAIQRGELADRLMPLPDASKLLAVHPRTVKRRFAAHQIPTAAIFKTPFPLLRWFVRRSWVEAQMTNPTDTTTN
jgi:hypothetical protein